MLSRISEVLEPRREQAGMLGRLRSSRRSLGGIVEQFESLMPRSQAEASLVKQRLARAGFRAETAGGVFYGSKVVVPLLLAAVALVSGLGSLNPLLAYTIALGVGFIAPNLWLDAWISRRQQRLRRALPDVLDLLVICIEAGQSLDQATARTAQELSRAYPELCDELSLLMLEQRAGRPRIETWKNLAERTGEESLRHLVSMVVQSEQLGTSIARTLRVQADSLRTQRVQAIEEQAAKTSVKLVFPLVLFIFPALFLVTLGPAVILMLDSFKTLTNP
jgi:tight adherence protein C